MHLLSFLHRISQPRLSLPSFENVKGVLRCQLFAADCVICYIVVGSVEKLYHPTRSMDTPSL